MQICQFAFELDVEMRVAADVARTAGTCTHIVQCFFHRRDNLGMLAHGEVIVGTPDRDRLRPVMAVEAAGVGIGTLVAQDVDEHPVPPFGMKPVDRLVENLVVIQRIFRALRRTPPAANSVDLGATSLNCHRDLCERFALKFGQAIDTVQGKGGGKALELDQRSGRQREVGAAAPEILT